MQRKQPTPQSRKLAHSRKNASKVEQHLSQVERVHGHSQAWEQRERLERGEVTLNELKLS